ncbi:MAG: hypothetical protein AAF293_20910 [Pseudomonadota bacterium]
MREQDQILLQMLSYPSTWRTVAVGTLLVTVPFFLIAGCMHMVSVATTNVWVKKISRILFWIALAAASLGSVMLGIGIFI